MDAVSQADGLGEDLRQTMDVDIACAGFGPAMGGFLHTVTRAWDENPSDAAFQSAVAEGMPLQVVCYERSDDLAAAVSGVVTRARGIRSSFPDLKADEIPLATEIRQEKVLYLLDPIGASRRSLGLRFADTMLRALGPLAGIRHHAFALPWIPGFLHKRGGLLLSLGQFNQWVASQLLSTGFVQIWPGTPVVLPLFTNRTLAGLRLADQGVDKNGAPAEGYLPGMDVQARLTVVGDGAVGAIGRAIDEVLGTPKGHARRDWALGMKFLIELPEGSDQSANAKTGNPTLEPGTIWHTLGYPEPEIFGFLYVHPDRLVSVGIVVPSWMHDPARTAYRYLQHFIQHPALWRYLKDGTLRSWGAKSLEESGRQGEPFFCGDGFARIGEGSGSTNLLSNSGVDEAWTTGVQLGESVVELLRAGKPFTAENLDATYGERRRASWVDKGAREAENARVGFHWGTIRGLIGLALAGLTRGNVSFAGSAPPPWEQMQNRRKSLKEILTRRTAAQLAVQDGRPFHDALLTARGWPEIVFDGRLLVTHQDALLMGGKVQAAPGFADHVQFRDLSLCAECEDKTCVAMCSGQAITLNAEGLPTFEREKCVHCGACIWNCSHSEDGEHGNIEFRAGSGGLHSAEN